MKIFITGIRGFIPSHLANHLVREHHSVYGIDNNFHPSKNPLDSDVVVEYGDVRYSEDIEDFIKRADLVYHMAAQINVDKSIAHPQETIDINFEGTVNVLNACRRYNKKLVFASTSEIYGSHDGSISENAPTYAQSPYAAAKLAADKLCGNYHQLYGLQVYRVRGFNTYGPYQSNDQYGAVIPIFTRRIAENQLPVIFGDGEQTRDYIYITDMVKAYEIIPTISVLNGAPVNVGTGKSISINQLAERVLRYLITWMDFKKIPSPIHVAPRAGEVKHLQADISLLSKATLHQWQPLIDIDTGLSNYIDWYVKEYIKKGYK